MLQQFDLSLQYEFAGGLLVEAAYAGAGGLHCVPRVNIGMIRFSDALAGKTTQAERPLNYVNESPREGFAIVNKWYYSFNLRVGRRFSKGLTFFANYTISKNVNQRLRQLAYTQEGDTAGIDTYNLKLERGLSPLDIPHKFVVSVRYDSRLVPGRPCLRDAASAAALQWGNKAFGKLTGSQTVGQQVQFGLKVLF